MDSLTYNGDAELLRCEGPLIVRAILIEASLIPAIGFRAARIKDETWLADGFGSKGQARRLASG